MRTASRAASPYLFAILNLCCAGSFLCGLRRNGSVPEFEASLNGILVRTEDYTCGEVLHHPGIASSEQNVICDERCAEPLDDVEDRLSPALLSAALEAGEADVLLVG